MGFHFQHGGRSTVRQASQVFSKKVRIVDDVEIYSPLRAFLGCTLGSEQQ